MTVTERNVVVSEPPAGSAENYSGQAVAVHFEGVKAVDNVDIDIYRGEILGLIGPNGAGKTTLVNALTGFTPLTSGTLTLGGQDLTGLPPHKIARRGVFRTFQGVRLFTNLTAIENVEVAAVSTGLPRRAARSAALEALDLLGITRHADTLANRLPYGDERRLALARSVVSNPRFLLLDEPAAGLDENESRELADIIRQLRVNLDNGIMIIEHDMNVIMGICDRIHVVDRGQTIAVGAPEHIRTNEAVISAYLGSAKKEPTDA